MLAILYLLAATAFGDIICRRFFRFDSLPHRAASAFLAGTLISTCVTYGLAVIFSATASPLMWANIAYAVCLASFFYLTVKFWVPVDDFLSGVDSGLRPPGNWRWDFLCLGVCLAFGFWLMFGMLNYKDGNINFTIGAWSDFGANLSLAQSFALGNNYPAEHPFFPGETIRYHFLLWFLSGNLSHLGLNIVWAVNLIGLLSLLALLALMMTFAEKLFHSRAVARISLIFFFFASSSLYYLPFLASTNGFSDAITSIISRKNPLVSGFPYNGEGWGSLSVISFVNQRQLIGACGILLIVLIYIVGFYRERGVFATIGGAAEGVAHSPLRRSDIAAMAFAGVLIGLLPYLNTAVFISAMLVLVTLLCLFPYRRTVVASLLAAVAVGLPQILVLRSGNTVAMSTSFFNWGYTIVKPTVLKLIEYLAWTFGLKWALLAVAVWFIPSSHRRLLLALSIPAVAVFSVQLSVEMVNNHKLLNVWGVLTASFVAYAIWIIGRGGVARKVMAAVMTLLLIFGAIIDLFPIHNDGYIATPYGNDRLTTWVLENTKPTDVFISEMWLSHPILFAGRKLFFGNTLFAWTAGYGGLQERDKLYKRILKTNNPPDLVGLLHENRISYIAVDDGFRHNDNSRFLDESMLLGNFELTFDDTENKYSHLKIYRVP